MALGPGSIIGLTSPKRGKRLPHQQEDHEAGGGEPGRAERGEGPAERIDQASGR